MFPFDRALRSKKIKTYFIGHLWSFDLRCFIFRCLIVFRFFSGFFSFLFSWDFSVSLLFDWFYIFLIKDKELIFNKCARFSDYTTAIPTSPSTLGRIYRPRTKFYFAKKPQNTTRFWVNGKGVVTLATPRSKVSYFRSGGRGGWKIGMSDAHFTMKNTPFCCSSVAMIWFLRFTWVKYVCFQYLGFSIKNVQFFNWYVFFYRFVKTKKINRFHSFVCSFVL